MSKSINQTPKYRTVFLDQQILRSVSKSLFLSFQWIRAQNLAALRMPQRTVRLELLANQGLRDQDQHDGRQVLVRQRGHPVLHSGFVRGRLVCHEKALDRQQHLWAGLCREWHRILAAESGPQRMYSFGGPFLLRHFLGLWY